MIINSNSQWMLIKLIFFILKNKFPIKKWDAWSSLHLRLFKGLRKSKNASKKKQPTKISSSAPLVISFWEPQETISDYWICMFESRLSTAFTFTRCTEMKNSQAGHFVFSFIHIMKEPWRSSVQEGSNCVFQQKQCLKLLINGGTLCSPPVYACSSVAGRESLEQGLPHRHHLSPLVLFLISRQQACLRSSFWSLRPRSTFEVHNTAWWKHRDPNH